MTLGRSSAVVEGKAPRRGREEGMAHEEREYHVVDFWGSLLLCIRGVNTLICD